VSRRTGAGAPPRSISVVVKIVLTVLYVIPLVWIILEALKSAPEALSAPDAVLFSPTLATLRSVIGEAGASVLLSLKVTVAASGAVILFGLPASYALARRTTPWWSRVVSVILILLLFLQMVPQPMTVIPLYGMLAQWHLLGSLTGLIIADTALVLPFSVLLLRPFVLAIPETLYESAALDGAGGFQIFLRIVVPLMRNGLATVASIVFILVWGEFIYASNFITEGSTYPVSALLAQQIGTYSTGWNTLMALALLTSIPLLVIFVFAQRRLTAGLTIGAIK